ncbi:cytochrome c oxidase copper chaperone [Musa troglodytarum]|uniref:Cytochrome c oxidase copper chaperone n=1 Tax=Musa troglodytarum TaxID=320322 RepID=A0A9E7L3W6_9LILI|nr:cytochrome c oxidase copper chaperone [Musa troglodytarum]
MSILGNERIEKSSLITYSKAWKSISINEHHTAGVALFLADHLKDLSEAGMHLQANLPDPPIRQGLAAAGPTPDDRKPKKKICCACPDTKKLRDECIVEHGEAACQKRIQAHLQCLRAEGFKV